MADDRNNPDMGQEQEYEFPDRQTKEFGSSPLSGGTESLSSLLKNKQVMYAIGGIVGLYVILSLFSSDEDEVINDVEAVAPQVVQDDTFDMSDDITIDAMGSSSPQLSVFDSIDQEAEKADKTAEDIDSLKRQIASLNRQNVDFRTQVKQLDIKLDTLQKTVERAARQISDFSQQQDLKKSEEKVEVLQDYKIRAVISGRAWIEDKTGNNLTVKVGDNIPTYGRVTKIRPVEGVIETSSGRNISFSHDE